MFRTYCQKNIAYFAETKLRTYYLSCREHTSNIGSKRVTVTNRVIRDKSRCANCLSNKSQLMAQEDSKRKVKRKKVNKNLVKKVAIEYYKTNMLTYCLMCKRYTEVVVYGVFWRKRGRAFLNFEPLKTS